MSARFLPTSIVLGCIIVGTCFASFEQGTESGKPAQAPRKRLSQLIAYGDMEKNTILVTPGYEKRVMGVLQAQKASDTEWFLTVPGRKASKMRRLFMPEMLAADFFTPFKPGDFQVYKGRKCTRQILNPVPCTKSGWRPLDTLPFTPTWFRILPNTNRYFTCELASPADTCVETGREEIYREQHYADPGCTELLYEVPWSTAVCATFHPD